MTPLPVLSKASCLTPLSLVFFTRGTTAWIWGSFLSLYAITQKYVPGWTCVEPVPALCSTLYVHKSCDLHKQHCGVNLCSTLHLKDSNCENLSRLHELYSFAHDG